MTGIQLWMGTSNSLGVVVMITAVPPGLSFVGFVESPKAEHRVILQADMHRLFGLLALDAPPFKEAVRRNETSTERRVSPSRLGAQIDHDAPFDAEVFFALDTATNRDRGTDHGLAGLGLFGGGTWW